MTANEKDMQEFEAAMRWNGFFSPQRSGWNGSNGYTSARDADRYAGWRMAREAAAEELQRLQAIEAAASTTLAAFEALGTAQNAGAVLMERGNCEAAMVALKAVVFNPTAKRRVSVRLSERLGVYPKRKVRR